MRLGRQTQSQEEKVSFQEVMAVLYQIQREKDKKAVNRPKVRKSLYTLNSTQAALKGALQIALKMRSAPGTAQSMRLENDRD